MLYLGCRVRFMARDDAGKKWHAEGVVKTLSVETATVQMTWAASKTVKIMTRRIRLEKLTEVEDGQG